MAIEDDDKPRKKVTHALMTSEIERLQQAATKKRASKDAANSFFKS